MGAGSPDNIAATYITLVIPSMMHYSMQRERYKRALLPAAAPETAQSAWTPIIGGTTGLTFDILYSTNKVSGGDDMAVLTSTSRLPACTLFRWASLCSDRV